MFALFRSSVTECGQRVGSTLQRINSSNTVPINRLLHQMRPALSNNSILSNTSTLLAVTQSHQFGQSRGLKYVDNVHRRCKFCYMHLINGVLHNHCTVHPRHKQQKRTPRPKHTWLITMAQQSSKRSW